MTLNTIFCFMAAGGVHFLMSDVNDKNDLGEFIRERRLSPEIDMSVRALAKEIGVSPGYLSQIETGVSPSTGRPPKVRIEHLQRLAHALRVAEQELVVRAGITPDGYKLLREDELEYVLNPDVAMIVEAYEGANATGKRAIKSAAELALEMDRESSIGKRAE